VSFENPTGAPGSGGEAAGGRKGAAFRVVRAGERVVLADLDGPGTITHLWCTFNTVAFDATPAVRRAQTLEVFYDGLDGPSVSVPAPDWFGAVHGMAPAYASALTTLNEGLGYASRVPMPFHRHLRMEWHNQSSQALILYYQADLLTGPLDADTGVLHAVFRRANPTVLTEDFTVAGELEGPGRFLGWTGGVRVLDPTHWWGEGEVKMFLDEDGPQPTVCGTGTEDYLDSAWGIGSYAAPEAGAPLVLAADGEPDEHHRWVGFYRWHLSDPVVFARSLRVTIQQIGSAIFTSEQMGEYATFKDTHQAAGTGWLVTRLGGAIGALGLYERADDWCATSFVYCASAQPVPRVDVDTATADLPSTMQGLRTIRRA
jgi:hypothetical protein